jgi:hypothetical protein
VPYISTYRVNLPSGPAPSFIKDPFPAPVVPPFEKQRPFGSGLVARPPVIDRFPIVIGQNLNAQYLTSAYRLGTSGWRYQFVDLLNELLEHDGHARAVTRQRVLAVAGGRLEILPALLRKDHPQLDEAKELADEFGEQFSGIPASTQAISQLNWGVIYGVSALETEWEKEGSAWNVLGLSNVHTRRLNYPNPTTWDLHIYDQGLVGPTLDGYGETNGVYGLRVANYPGKFVVHTPALNADYPTRDGEGRYIGILMLLKRMVMRASAQDFERTIRPWVLGYFNRDAEEVPGGKPRSVAQPEDILALEAALKVLGSGSMSNAALPDSVKVELLRAASAMSATEFLSFLNREMSKALLGQAFTTEPGANGNLSTSQMAKEGTMEILRYDARCLADTLERDLVKPWMRLNRPEVKRQLLPRVVIHVDEIPDPEKVMKIAVQGTSIDLAIDQDKLAEQTGLMLVAAKDPKTPRRTRMIQSGKPPEPVGKENSEADDQPAPEIEPEAKDDSAEAASKPKPNGKTNGKAEAAPH